MVPSFIPSALAVAATALAAGTDARTGRIPNPLTVPLLAGALLLHFFSGGAGGLLASIVGAAVCAATPLVLFSRGGMGGGDVKLFAALGALVGATPGLEIQIVAFVVTGAVAVVGLVRQRRLSYVLKASLRRAGLIRGVVESPAEDDPGVRMGVPIFVAAAVCLWSNLAGS
jgi:prepilin peptidase CpaA